MIQLKHRRVSGFLVAGLNEQRLAGEFCDVILTIGKRQFPAHRNVLAANSPYFRTMFSSDLQESGKKTIPMDGSITKKEVLHMLMDYFYTGEITISGANVQSLLAAADLLLLPELKIDCCTVLKAELAPTNCLGIWLLADRHSCNDLCKMAFLFSLNTFDSVVADRGEFLELSLAHLLKLLKSDKLSSESEEMVLLAAMRWIRHGETGRKAHLIEILSTVRLTLCTEAFLAKTGNEDALIQDSVECRRTIAGAILAKNQQKPPPMKKRKVRPSFLAPVDQPRTPAPHPQSLCIFSTYAKTVEKTVPLVAHGQTFSVTIAPIGHRSDFAIATLADRIFVHGGIGNADNTTMECYNTSSNQWTSLAPMSTAHYDHCAAVLDGKIYAIAGNSWHGQTCTIVERYDPGSDVWTRVAPLATDRHHFAAVTLDDAIYVLGGKTNFSDILCDVERFDLNSGSWTTATPMRSPRKSFGCAVFDGKIFVAGGLDKEYDFTDSLSSVECFDPIAQQWTVKGSLIEARHWCSLTVIDGRLLAIGGCREPSERRLESVEEYDPVTDSWRRLCNFEHACYGRMCVIPALFDD